MAKKVGLALSGGAARGLAHIGVLEVLQKEGVPIDMIAGTSSGALVGAVYAQGKDANLIKEEALELSKKRLTSLIDLTLPKTGFIEGKKIKDALQKLIGGDIKFADLKIPLAVVATDIITGEEVVISEGSVLEAVRASISLPIIFTVVKLKGRYLVDGAMVNPVPVKVLKKMGADFIIAVNVIPEVTDRVRIDKEEKNAYKQPNIFNVITQTFYIGNYALVNSCLEGSNIVIKPRVAHIGPHDFFRVPECISQGELAAEDAIPEIRKHLKLKSKK